MSVDRDLDRAVRSWLREDGHEDAEHVLGAVLQDIDSTIQRRQRWVARIVSMNGLRIASAVAAVVIVAVVMALAFDPRPSPGTNGSPTPTQSASPTTTLIDTTTIGQTLASGTFRVGSPFDIGLRVTLSGTWKVLDLRNGQISFGGSRSAYLGFFLVRDVPVDPCHPDTGSRSPFDPPDASTLVDALRSLEGFRAGPVTTLTIGGRTARHFRLRNSIDTESGECTNGLMLPIFEELGDGPVSTNGGTSQEVWVVDVLPRPVLIVGETGTDRAALLDRFDEILGTVSFE